MNRSNVFPADFWQRQRHITPTCFTDLTWSYNNFAVNRDFANVSLKLFLSSGVKVFTYQEVRPLILLGVLVTSSLPFILVDFLPPIHSPMRAQTEKVKHSPVSLVLFMFRCRLLFEHHSARWLSSRLSHQMADETWQGCRQFEEEGALHTFLGGPGVQDKEAGGVADDLHCLRFSRQEVQQPVAEAGVQPQVVQFVDELVGDNRVER